MGLNADDPRPPYLQIADEIRRSIQAGDYQPGEQLPTGRELADKWDVAINTAQRAVEKLRTDELVYGIQGKGNFVRSDIAGSSAAEAVDADLDQQVRNLKDELQQVKKRVAKLERKSKVVD